MLKSFVAVAFTGRIVPVIETDWRNDNRWLFSGGFRISANIEGICKSCFGLCGILSRVVFGKLLSVKVIGNETFHNCAATATYSKTNLLRNSIYPAKIPVMNAY